MKKITLALLVLLTALASNSQSIVPRGTPTNTMQDYRLDVKNNLVVPRYLDTATANLTNNKGLDSSGALIKTYNPDAIWVRQSNPKRWFNLSGLSTGGTLATVATTGAYADLTGKPTIPAGQVQSDWNATVGLGTILNKPIAMTVATLRTATTTTNTVYDLLDHGGGQVQDLGLNDGSYNDDDGMIFISGNAHVVKRIVAHNEVTPEYWQGKVGDGLSDTAAFGKMTRYCLYNGAAINISAKGIYNFDGSWIIPGSPLTGLGINIHSTHEAILKFGHLASGIAVQYGTPNSNTLNGVVDNLHVEADSTVDGFVVSSHAPYSASFNTFNNLFLYGVKDGVHFDGLSSNPSSNYQLTFNNLRVQGFWGHAIHNTGAMITFNHGFAVSPYGNGLPARAGTGTNSLAVYDLSSASTYNGIRTEDQWVLNGSFTRVSGQSTIEYIVKDTANTLECGSTAIRIGGSNVTIDGFDLITVPNKIVNEFMQVYSPNVSLKNIVYNNPGNDPRYIITYPILPSNTSSGVMENINVKTVYPVNHPAFADGVKNWSFVNVLGLGDTVFARIKNLEMSALVETDPSFVNAAKLAGGGQTISAFTTINDFKVATTSEIRGIVYDFAGHVIPNAAADDYLRFITVTTPGKRSFSNVDNISGITGTFVGRVTGAAGVNPGDFATMAQVPDVTALLNKTTGGTVSGYTYFTGGAQLTDGSVIDGVLYDRASAHFGTNKASSGYLPLVGRDVTGSEAVWNYDNVGTLNPNGNEVSFGGIASAQGFGMKIGATTVAKILPNGIDANNAGWTFQYKASSVYHDGLRLDRFGDGWIAGKFSGHTATVDSNYIPLGQFKDSLAGYHRLTDSTAFHIGEYLTGNGTLATPLNVDINKVLQTGTFSFTGDGVTTAFTIVLDIVGMSSTSTVFVTASNSVGAAIDYIDVTTTSIIIHYLTAPTSGVKNLKYLIKP